MSDFFRSLFSEKERETTNQLKRETKNLSQYPGILSTYHDKNEMIHCVNEKYLALLTTENNLKLVPKNQLNQLSTNNSNPIFIEKNAQVQYKRISQIAFKPDFPDILACIHS